MGESLPALCDFVRGEHLAMDGTGISRILLANSFSGTFEAQNVARTPIIEGTTRPEID
jgi:hypothetical protein